MMRADRVELDTAVAAARAGEHAPSPRSLTLYRSGLLVALTMVLAAIVSSPLAAAGRRILDLEGLPPPSVVITQMDPYRSRVILALWSDGGLLRLKGQRALGRRYVFGVLAAAELGAVLRQVEEELPRFAATPNRVHLHSPLSRWLTICTADGLESRHWEVEDQYRRPIYDRLTRLLFEVPLSFERVRVPDSRKPVSWSRLCSEREAEKEPVEKK